MNSEFHLVVDAREACRERRTGKGQWTRGFVDELIRRGTSLTLLTDAEAPIEWHRPWVTFRYIPRMGLRWHLSAARIIHAEHRSHLYVSPTSYLVPFVLGRTVRCVPVVHDIVSFRPELMSGHERRAFFIERCTLSRALRTAFGVCAVSTTTRDDLLTRFPALNPDRVIVLGAGPMTPTPPPTRPDGKTIVCPATLSPRKNQLRLIEAFASLPRELRSRHELILLGARGWQDDDIVARVAATPGVRWLGEVSDTEYQSILSNATILAVPSLFEGFGLQVLDALQRGLPVLTSDHGSLKEVAGDAAQYVNPERVESIAAGLKALLTDPTRRLELSARGIERASRWTWRKAADAFYSFLPSRSD